MATLAEHIQRYLPTADPDLPAEWQVKQPRTGEFPRLVLDGLDWFNEISQAINATSSGDRVWIAGWTMQHGLANLGNRLVERAEADVDVRVILWCNPWSDHPDASESGLVVSALPFSGVVGTNLAAAIFLRNTKIAEPSPRLADRVLLDWSGPMTTSMHQKTVVIVKGGQATGYVSGFDFASDRVGTTGHRSQDKEDWHDAGVVLGGDGALDVYDNFVARWVEAVSHVEETTEVGKNLIDAFRDIDVFVDIDDEIDLIPQAAPPLPVRPNTGAPVASNPNAATQVLRSIPTHHVLVEDPFTWQERYTHYPPEGIDEYWDLMKKAIPSAKKYIYVEDQFIGNRGLTTGASPLFEMLSDALNASPSLQVLLVGRSPDGDIERDDDAEELAESFPGRVHVFARPKKLVVAALIVGDFVFQDLENAVNLHSKVMVVDDELLCVGSANFMDRSMSDELLTVLDMDCELQVASVSTGDDVRDARVAMWADMAMGKKVADLSAQELSDLRDLDIAIPALFGAGTPPSSSLSRVSGWTRLEVRP